MSPYPYASENQSSFSDINDVSFIDNLNLIYLNQMYRPGTSISKAKVKSSNNEEGQYNKVQQ